jgi:glutamyl-tRNA reductase
MTQPLNALLIGAGGMGRTSAKNFSSKLRCVFGRLG